MLEVDAEQEEALSKLLQYMTISFQKIESAENTDEEVVTNIRQELNESRLVDQGKMKATPFNDFLKELEVVQQPFCRPDQRRDLRQEQTKRRSPNKLSNETR